MGLIKFLHDKMIYIVFLLILVSGYLGFYWREAFLALKFTLPIALFLMLLKPMVYMDLKKAFTKMTSTKFKYLVLVTAFYVAVFPLLTYGFMRLILAVFPGLDSRIVAAIVIMGLSPIASSAPAFVGMAGGRVQLALVGVIWTFLLSIAVIPFYGHWMLNSVIHVPVNMLLYSILWYVIVPLAAGQAIKYLALWARGQAGLDSLRDPLSLLSLLGLYWMVVEVFGINSHAVVMMSLEIAGLVALMYVYHLTRFGLAYYSGRAAGMPLDRVVSLVYSSSVNMTMSTAIAISAFGTLAGVGTILAGPFSEMILMILFVRVFQKYIHA